MFRLFDWQNRVCVKFANADETCISHSQNIRIYACFGVFEQLEVMGFALADSRTDDTPASAVDYNLSFQSVTLLLTGVVFVLFFLGRSIGRSVASISVVLIVSFVSNAFLPGRVNFPDFIRVFSIHMMIL